MGKPYVPPATEMPHRVIAIDPGIQTAMLQFEVREPYGTVPRWPTDYALVRTMVLTLPGRRKGETQPERLARLPLHIQGAMGGMPFRGWDESVVVIEYGRMTEKASQARRGGRPRHQGDLFAMGVHYMAIIAAIQPIALEIVGITPREWMANGGRMPKREATLDRIQNWGAATFGRMVTQWPEDSIMALGMLDYFMQQRAMYTRAQRPLPYRTE